MNVPSRRLAHGFYVGLLGGGVHPVGTLQSQLHVNFGGTQVHLPFARPVVVEAGAPPPARDFSIEGVDAVEAPSLAENDEFYGAPQLWDGVVEFWTARKGVEAVCNDATARGIDAARCACHADAQELAWECLRARKAEGVDAARELVRSAPGGGDAHAVVVCPWGNVYVLREAQPAVAAALGPDTLGHQPNATETTFTRVIGIAHVHVLGAPGAAAAALPFYRDTLGGLCALANARLDVVTGVHQLFSVHDDATAAPYDACVTNAREFAYHVCVYVREPSIAEVERKLTAAGAIYRSDRFQKLDASCAEFQVRARTIAPQFWLETEVRTLGAPMCPLRDELPL